MTGWTKNKKANKSESKTNVGPLTRPFAKWTNSSSIAIRVRMTPLSGDQTKQRHPALRRRRKGWVTRPFGLDFLVGFIRWRGRWFRGEPLLGHGVWSWVAW